MIKSMIKIGIHHSKGSYSEGWIEYCKKQNIAYKTVNAYRTDIVSELEDCEIFMWHHHHANPKDALFAKQLLFSLEQSGKFVYPDTVTTWHFDDKLGQKYLLEALKLPLIPSYVFYTKNEALDWAASYNFPAIFKLRGGAGSSNVRLVRSKEEAISLIKKAFNNGFRQYDPIAGIKDSIQKFKNKKVDFIEVLRSMAHLVYPYKLEKSKGRERGYIYFQEYLSDCKFDIRIQFIHNRCYAMKRYVRYNDFRASGSGIIDYDGSKIPIDAIKLSFDISKKLKMQTLAIDMIPYKNNYLLAEISYAFAIDEGECEFGYWDSDITWQSGSINPYGWMVEDMIRRYNER